MTAREKAYRNIDKWRSLSKASRRAFSRSSVVDHVKNSMAMEGEPVSKSWLKKNAR